MSEANYVRYASGEFRAGVLRVRKKPVEVEAVRYDGTMDSFNVIHDWMGPEDDPNHPNCGYQGTEDEPGKFAIKTLEGKVTAIPGDWIIKGVKGEFYPCKPDIFAATYDTLAAEREASDGVSAAPSPAVAEVEQVPTFVCDYQSPDGNTHCGRMVRYTDYAALAAELADLNKQKQT